MPSKEAKARQVLGGLDLAKCIRQELDGGIPHPLPDTLSVRAQTNVGAISPAHCEARRQLQLEIASVTFNGGGNARWRTTGLAESRRCSS
jgi:hypothetical protein